MKANIAFIILSVTLYSELAPAVVPGGFEQLTSMTLSGNSQNKQTSFTIRIIPSCFEALQKPVYNPVAPVGSINFAVSLAGTTASATFPSWTLKKLSLPTVSNTQIVDLTAAPLVEGANASYSNLQSGFAARNIVVLRLATEPTIAAVDALGGYVPGDRVQSIDYIRFRYDQQAGAQCPPGPPPYASWCTQASNSAPPQNKFAAHTNMGKFFGSPIALLYSMMSYAGIATVDARYTEPNFDAPAWGNPEPTDPIYTTKDGQISYMLRIAFSSDLKQMNVRAAFPSATPGWCDSYYCPLMLFFDEKRPSFYGVSQFKINPYGVTNWPEKNAPGYFLARDLNNNGMIDGIEELIGDQKQDSNGFQILKPLDIDENGRIDSKDPVYSHLLLWQDLDSDGVSTPAELHSLQEMGVRSISLKYKYDQVVSLGARAELRERATFQFDDETGKKKTGEIIDVWLSGNR